MKESEEVTEPNGELSYERQVLPLAGALAFTDRWVWRGSPLLRWVSSWLYSGWNTQVWVAYRNEGPGSVEWRLVAEFRGKFGGLDLTEELEDAGLAEAGSPFTADAVDRNPAFFTKLSAEEMTALRRLSSRTLILESDKTLVAPWFVPTGSIGRFTVYKEVAVQEPRARVVTEVLPKQ